MILAIKTDSVQAYIALLNHQSAVIGEKMWDTGRTLSKDLLINIDQLIKKTDKKPESLNGIVVFHGPGSFTGLRIGVVVANTLAYSLNIPNVGTGGEKWIDDGISQLHHLDKPAVIVPHYGKGPNITTPKGFRPAKSKKQKAKGDE